MYWQVGRRVVTNGRPSCANCGDVVLGPTQAGSVYLIGLREPQPALFRGVQWSSAAVQAQLKARAADARLVPHLLRPLREVETLQDARALGLLTGRSNIDVTST